MTLKTDVMIDPKQQRVIVNSLYPDMASSIIKNIESSVSNVYSS